MSYPQDFTHTPVIERETALVKLHASTTSRAAIATLVPTFGAKLVDEDGGALLIELTTTPAQIERFIEQVRPYGMKELTRTGRIAMVRGAPLHRMGVPLRMPVRRHASTAERAVDPLLTFASFRSQADGAA